MTDNLLVMDGYAPVKDGPALRHGHPATNEDVVTYMLEHGAEIRIAEPGDPSGQWFEIGEVASPGRYLVYPLEDKE